MRYSAERPNLTGYPFTYSTSVSSLTRGNKKNLLTSSQWFTLTAAVFFLGAVVLFVYRAHAGDSWAVFGAESSRILCLLAEF